MGVVDDVGPEVKNFKKGDRVVACFDLACGSCAP
jgi:threonine dehydrogenase-like Zn-dependent dehydrogenase